MALLTRRAFAKTAVVAAAGAALGAPALAAARPKVVVIGGGAGGGCFAGILASMSLAVDVTLVEANPTHTTCFLGNWFLGGFRSLDALTFDYAGHARGQGPNVVTARAATVDAETRTVRLEGGETLAYDILVVAPGIAFRYDEIEGLNAETAQRVPHAYSGGEQLRLLKNQLEAMDNGGQFVMSVPTTPYRCPPAPYERATMVAHYFKRHKPDSTILILDAKQGFPEQDLYEDAWDAYYPDMIEWLPGDMIGGDIRAVDLDTLTLSTEDESFEGDVVNLIPPQRAGDLAVAAGLTDETGWCPVDPATLESTRVPGIYVLGDAIGVKGMPKAASIAQTQAQVCAETVAARLGLGAPPEAVYRTACWSILAERDAIKVGATYRPSGAGVEASDPIESERDEDPADRAANIEDATTWYGGITAQMFG